MQRKMSDLTDRRREALGILANAPMQSLAQMWSSWQNQPDVHASPSISARRR
jgi:hypothetical protein